MSTNQKATASLRHARFLICSRKAIARAYTKEQVFLAVFDKTFAIQFRSSGVAAKKCTNYSSIAESKCVEKNKQIHGAKTKDTQST